MEDRIVEWAKELQSIAQAGLYYGKDVYDGERYQRIRDIAAEMMLTRADVPAEKIKGLFCADSGYQTPKIDTRAAVFQDGKILLVREKNSEWNLPGGWCEYNLTPAENTVKEAKEEAGLDVEQVRLIAVQDREKHNSPPHAFHIIKIFFLCRVLGGAFMENSETTASDWFALDDLPLLSQDKSTEEQVKMCFDAYRDENWNAQFD